MRTMHTILHAALLTMLAAMLSVTDAIAQPEFQYTLPVPYTSFDDSPFGGSSGFGFCNETFEDGTFDIPGVTSGGSVVGPGGQADSVDSDDGAIDGSGTNGRSYFSGDGTTGIVLTFPDNRTNGLPTKVGIVWTDGGGGAPVFFEAFDSTGVSFGIIGPNLHADLSNNGETGEDRFYGITSASGISKIRISNAGGGIEVDHVQLDRCVVCGDTNFDLHITTSDALFALRTAVGLTTCLPCVCDVNNSSTTTTGDALTILRKSVALNPVMNCPACAF